VLGNIGERYRLRIVNPTPARVEAVISVDGLDAIDGQPASQAKRGYVIPAFGDTTIDGWRTSLDTVAAFRFSSVRDSFAARTQDDRNVGVIGVAFFRERPPVPVAMGPRPMPKAAATRSAEGSRAAPAPNAAEDRGGLGTQFGETHDSRVVQTMFVRAEANAMTIAELRYDDRQGLLARGIAVPPMGEDRMTETELRDTARPFADTRFAQPPSR